MNKITYIGTCLIALAACGQPSADSSQLATDLPKPPQEKMRVILDTDANNELDDQHAIAYLLFNRDFFEVEGITVNATRSGGGIESHLAEANRVIDLCGATGEFPVIAGAEGSFEEILPTLGEDVPAYDGQAAVAFIISRARAASQRPLILVPIGKLTNIALALQQAPDIANKIRVVWLGSNWPDAGEYNLDNDTSAVNPLLGHPGLDFEIVTVRYGAPSGTAAVTASVEEIRGRMAGLGPEVTPVAGRHGGTFTRFGDYSIDLFTNIGDEVRALFDVCALAILKNPEWAEARTVPAPLLVGNGWQERPENTRTVIFWENFDKAGIMADFYASMEAAGKASL